MCVHAWPPRTSLALTCGFVAVQAQASSSGNRSAAAAETDGSWRVEDAAGNTIFHILLIEVGDSGRVPLDGLGAVCWSGYGNGTRTYCLCCV